jgi:transcriptional regulator with XRE-family HTH domain
MAEYRFDNRALKTRRADAGMRPAQVAASLGVAKDAYYRWETGRGLPPVDLLGRLCAELDCELGDLLVAIDPPAVVAHRHVARSRREQGLPERVQDEAALDATAALLRS